MKPFLIFCTIILTCTSFKIHEADNPKLSLSAIIVGVESKQLSVRVTLTNNSADTIKYVGWDCSWQDSYAVDTDKWKVIVNICFKNGHMTYQIPPHQSESKIIKLERMMGTVKSKTSAFKIGFHFIPPRLN